MNFDNIIQLKKQVSKAFNSSISYEEFLVNLDLLGINLEDAEEVYAKDPNMIKIFGKIDFEKLFKTDVGSGNVPALPYSVSIGRDKDFWGTTIKMKAIDVSGKDHIQVCAYNDDEELKDTKINMFKETCSTMLYEIAKRVRKGKMVMLYSSK